ncbi:hypothetical protein LTR56_007309 [Elasticomyces elasticus]|nr:hypothetical protein LTR56_007309 [Elasticomyces elasticus]KAK3662959.1 hypothetical protein LTR22_006123 [Elasticomyces elasticus]KAK4918923.1 hypothetical protein LTR49_013395 [Elasticomyces elasticus]KAK5753808.1 hypothetical protein LTS12_016117 [Elasticomyces elasticus]
MSTTGNTNSAESYTVAWITALPNERAAGESMFDANHTTAPQDFRRNTSDPNAYSWGKVGVHNVVIASLPAGEYGTNAAATIAQGLISSLPHIRVGLLVGIGAGILGEQRTKEATPEGHEIQLGDVAVSVPKGTTGGVVQFDLAKVQTVEGQEKITRIGWLNSPPIAMRTALTKLQAQHDREYSKVPVLIEQAFERYPKLRTKYSHPGQRTVPKVDTYHPRHGAAVAREAREVPEIHYGVIASSNTLVKNAQYRDDMLQHLGSEGVDPICIEMEAAGLMNSFPCLVIRGICDYADEYKNDDWQAYAAIAAAAICQGVSAMLIPVVKQIGEETTFVAKSIHEGRIRAWLAPADPSTNYNQACELRHPDTGRWFLDGEQYRRLKTLKNAALWLRGGSGCGKTVLSSAIISDLRNDAKSETSVTVYFFFDINDPKKQSVESMLRSLIFQLYQQAPASRAHLEKIHGEEQAQIRTLLAVWTVMCSTVDEVSVVIDALDECKSREDLLRRLPSVKCEHVRLLITSRPEYEIEVSIQRWIPEHDVVSVQRTPVDDDIRQVIRSHIYTDVGPFSRWKGKIGVLALIENRLMEKAGGMFRWAICQLDALQDCLSMGEIKDALRTLPRDLTETYARILQKVSERRRPCTTLLLQFLLHAGPLRLEEAVDAIAVSPDRTPAFEPMNRLPLPQEIARYCSSLTRITTRKRYPIDWAFASDHTEKDVLPDIVEIQLAHASVHDYLASEALPAGYQGCLRQEQAGRAILGVCTAYLMTVDQPLGRAYCSPDFPFTNFCVRHCLRRFDRKIKWVCFIVLPKTRPAWVMESFTPDGHCVYRVNRHNADTSKVVEHDTQLCEGENNKHYLTAPLPYAAHTPSSASRQSLLEHDVDVLSKRYCHDNAVTFAIWVADNANLRSPLESAGDVKPQEYCNLHPTACSEPSLAPHLTAHRRYTGPCQNLCIVISNTPTYSSFVTWVDDWNRQDLLFPMSAGQETVPLSTVHRAPSPWMGKNLRYTIAAALCCAYFEHGIEQGRLRNFWSTLRIHLPPMSGTDQENVSDRLFVISQSVAEPADINEEGADNLLQLAIMILELVYNEDFDKHPCWHDPAFDRHRRDPSLRRQVATLWGGDLLASGEAAGMDFAGAVQWLLYQDPADPMHFIHREWRIDFAAHVAKPLLDVMFHYRK